MGTWGDQLGDTSFIICRDEWGSCEEGKCGQRRESVSKRPCQQRESMGGGDR